MKDDKMKDDWRYHYIGDNAWIVDNFYSFNPEDQMIEAIDKKDLEVMNDAFTLQDESSDIDVHFLIESLPERYSSLLWDYYFEGKTLEKLGSERGYSKQYAHQELNKAISLLKDKM
jgi:DNA-directed RNA polymerase specialized sigma subunit